MAILPLVQAFFGDVRTLTLFTLILVDLLTGVFAALRTGQFAWRALAQVYRTNVLPYLGGYALVYFLGALGLLPLLGPVAEDLAQTVGWMTLAASLAASIGQNVRTLSRPAPEPPPAAP